MRVVGRWGRAALLALVVVSMVGLAGAPAGSASEARDDRNVVGGSYVTDVSRVPWMVALFQASVVNPVEAQFCGGILVDPWWVLTAAHCVSGSAPSSIQVGWGKAGLSSYGPDNRRAVVRIVKHPGYDASARRNDAALLALARPAEGVRTLALNRDPNQPTHRESLEILGWGSVQEFPPLYPQALRAANVNDLAGTSLPCGSHSAAFQADVMVCAGVDAGGIDTCAGDSGGPLVDWSIEPVTVGITSFGRGCARAAYPGIYTRVSAIADWAANEIESTTRRDLWGWGANSAGQLGDDVVSGHPTPFPSRTSGWSQVTAGDFFACGVRGLGTLWCWGSNADGRAGRPLNQVGSRTPARVGLDVDWRQISAGTAHGCGVRRAGELLCWGKNTSGALGDGSTITRGEPRRVGYHPWRSVSAGGAHTCAVRSDGTLWCWGSNAEGQLGDTTRRDRLDPKQIGARTDWRAIDTGLAHSCALRDDGSAYCWGRYSTLSPKKVVGGPFTQIATGLGQACAIRADASLWCWLLGAPAAARVGSSTGWSSVSVGADHTCGIRSGEAWCWGGNGDGEVGDGTQMERLEPVRAGEGGNWSSIAAGRDSTIGVRGDPELVDVTPRWTAAEAQRVLDTAAALGFTDVGAFQRDATQFLAYLVRLDAGGSPVPTELAPEGDSHAFAVSFGSAELEMLDDVNERFMVDGTDGVRLAVFLLEYLVALTRG